LKENTFSFSLLEPHFRRSVLAIRTEIGFLNEAIDGRNFCFEKAFEPGLTAENSLILDENIKECFERIAKLSRKIVEGIKELIRQEEAGNKNATR